MAKMIINGEVCSGSNSYASAVEYIKDDGTKSTVQNELSELNKKTVLFPDYANASVAYNEETILENQATVITIPETAYYFFFSNTLGVSGNAFIRIFSPLSGGLYWTSHGMTGVHTYLSSPLFLFEKGEQVSVQINGQTRYVYKIPLKTITL